MVREREKRHLFGSCFLFDEIFTKLYKVINSYKLNCLRNLIPSIFYFSASIDKTLGGGKAREMAGWRQNPESQPHDFHQAHTYICAEDGSSSLFDSINPHFC